MPRQSLNLGALEGFSPLPSVSTPSSRQAVTSVSPPFRSNVVARSFQRGRGRSRRRVEQAQPRPPAWELKQGQGPGGDATGSSEVWPPSGQPQQEDARGTCGCGRRRALRGRPLHRLGRRALRNSPGGRGRPRRRRDGGRGRPSGTRRQERRWILPRGRRQGAQAPASAA
jgi:hypothetical protein